MRFSPSGQINALNKKSPVHAVHVNRLTLCVIHQSHCLPSRFSSRYKEGEKKTKAKAKDVGTGCPVVKSWWNGSSAGRNVTDILAQTAFPYSNPEKEEKEKKMNKWGSDIWGIRCRAGKDIIKAQWPNNLLKIIRWLELKVGWENDLQDFITWGQRHINHSLGTCERAARKELVKG